MRPHHPRRRSFLLHRPGRHSHCLSARRQYLSRQTKPFRPAQAPAKTPPWLLDDLSDPRSGPLRQTRPHPQPRQTRTALPPTRPGPTKQGL